MTVIIQGLQSAFLVSQGYTLGPGPSVPTPGAGVGLRVVVGGRITDDLVVTTPRKSEVDVHPPPPFLPR